MTRTSMQSTQYLQTAMHAETVQDSNKIINMKESLKRGLDCLTSTPSPQPPVSSYQLRRHQLENNQIQHIQLGFCESCFSGSDYAKLCQALRVNKSLTNVEIGWELPRPILLNVLDCVARLPCLQSLSLTCYTHLPRRLLRRLVSKSTLCHLELRNITIGPSPWNERFVLNPNGKVVLNTKAHENASFLVNCFADSIQSLHFVACDLENEDFIRICQWTEQRPRPLRELSFAYSNSISSEALETLVSRASCKQLDLTSCGLSDMHASVIAKCLPQSKTIDAMVVARNRLWGSFCNTTHHGTPRPGFDEFIHVALHHLKGLDVSCCSISQQQVCDTLQLLAHDTMDNSCLLESLTMLGIPKDCENDKGFLSSLEQILQHNAVLKCLRFHPTTDLYRTPSLSNDAIALIERSLEDNYALEQLQVGCMSSIRIDHLLRLNRAGRRCLRNSPNAVPVDWAAVLGRASSCPDVVFWLLQNGVDKIFL